MQFLILLGLLGLSTVASFAGRPSFVTKTSTTKLSESLVFTAELNEETDVLSKDKNALCEFLTRETTKQLFISGGGSNNVEYVDATPEIMEIWKQKCRTYGRDESVDSSCEQFISGETAVNFPGMKLCITSLLLMRTDTGPDADCNIEFWTIGEKTRPEGLKPMVWIYNQLTNAKEKDPDVFIPSNAVAYSKAYVDEDQGGYKIKFEGNFEVKTEFPSALLKILPFSKEKSEEQGSKAIQKSTEVQCKAAVKAVVESYADCLHAVN